MTHFLFPADPLDPRRIDEFFLPQRDSLEGLGHTSSLVTERVFEGTRTLRGVPAGALVVYRGWMLTATQYLSLEQAIAAAGARPLTTTDQYLATHHLPNWYPKLTAFTPQTRIYPEDADLVAELTALGWSAFFIKDYVKSLKTSIGSLITKASDISRVVSEMRSFRGEVEGGICVREVEPLLATTERRYFVLHGRAFAPCPGDPIPEAVAIAVARIASPFFTVDVAEHSDSRLRIIELGDGQVSDLVGWTVESFGRLWPTSGAA